MSAYARLVAALYWLGLVLWCGAIMSGAVAAMNVFPALDEMPLVLADYPDYPAEAHPRLAAGRIMEGVFFTVDLLQVVAAPVTVVALAVQILLLGAPLSRPANLLRAACVAAAAALFAWHATMIAPGMNRELRAFWAAAETGALDEAAAHRSAFNAIHPRAERLQGIVLVLVLGAVVTSAAAGVTPRPQRRAPLEEPELRGR